MKQKKRPIKIEKGINDHLEMDGFYHDWILGIDKGELYFKRLSNNVKKSKSR